MRWVVPWVKIDPANLWFIVFFLALIGVLLEPFIAEKIIAFKQRVYPRTDQISDAFTEGTELQRLKISNDAEFHDWKKVLTSWMNDTADLLGRASGKAWRALFLEPGSAKSADIIGTFNKVHNSIMLRLELRLEVLRKILEKHGNR